MDMRKFRTLATVGVMSIAGLGLIGAGAHAVFTTSTTSNQQVTSGNLSVVLEGPSGSAGQDTAALTLPAVGPTQSSFTTGDQEVDMVNNGNINADEITLTLNTTYPTSGLAAELNVCLISTGLGVPSGDYFLFYNGPLTGVIGHSYNVANPSDVLVPTGRDNTFINVYAGDETTACGANTTMGDYPYPSPGTSTSASLDNGGMNQSIDISETITGCI